jgi:hypothetical protein
MTIREKVEQILNEIPQARGDDRLLIAYVIKDLYHIQNTFDIALSKEIKGNVYESVRRYRAKIQETNPTLRPAESIYKARLVREAEVREEMRGV